MKNLVLEISYNEEISAFTSKSVKDYSHRIGADYFMAEVRNLEEKYIIIFEYLKKYQRILAITSHTLIREDCPNLFKVVPKTKLGLFNEGVYVSKQLNMTPFIKRGELDRWNGKYYDTGILLASRMHKDLFDIEVQSDHSFDDILNYRILSKKIEVHELSYKYNHVHFVDSYHGTPRHASYILQYKEAPLEIAKKIIPDDIEKWKLSSPKFEGVDYRRLITVSVSAGMGDQLCAEPAIRYMQSLYPESDFAVVTHFPRLFEHLNCEVYSHEEWKGTNRTVLVVKSCPSPEDGVHNLSHVLFHPTDFASISMYRMIVPTNEKTIKLEVHKKDLDSIQSFIESSNKDLKSRPLVLIHPGKWWSSKTFPDSWWQSVIDGLAENFTVGLIGKTISDDQGYLPVECPENGIDFRDETSLGELIALISIAPILLTNDSSPLHIAGAFDNWVITIPTAKHPDHILPFRNGSQNYKTKALYKKILMEDLELRFTETELDTIDILPKGRSFDDYLPEPSVVIDEIKNISM